MRLRQIIYAFLALTTLAGCADAYIPESVPQIVVEGWIEDNGYPVVILTTTVPIDVERKNNESLQGYLIRWGKVTISDGEKEVVLTGMRNNDYFPPYIYTTSSIRGKAGKSYSLKVEYSGRTVTATTTVPEPVSLEYIKVKKSDIEDSYYLTGGLIDDRLTKDYYKFFVRRARKDSIYKPSFMGLVNDDILSENIEELPINSGISSVMEKTENFFSKDDLVFVRFSSLDEQSYAYWSDFDTIYSLSRNPFFPANSRIRTNIKGGLGYWAGYGSTYYMVSIPDSLAMGRVH